MPPSDRHIGQRLRVSAQPANRVGIRRALLATPTHHLGGRAHNTGYPVGRQYWSLTVNAGR